MTQTVEAAPVGNARQVQPTPDLETALRRAALWVPRGMPRYSAGLLAGTEGRLRYRRNSGDLYADLPTGEEIRVALCTENQRVFVTRIDGTSRVTASADLPRHLVEHAS